MRIARRFLNAPSSNEAGIAGPWGLTLVLLAFAIVVYGTLFPFNFVRHALQPFDLRAYDPSDLTDWIANVALFLPFGFAMGCLMAGRGARQWRGLIAAVVASALLSACVEALQQFLPTRDPSVADVLANTTGGLFGAHFLHHGGLGLLEFASSLARRVRRHLAARGAAVLFFAWMAVIVAVPAQLLRSPRLAGWDASFPLLVGAEPTRERPWEGSISELHFADRAASQAEAGRILSGEGDGFATVMGGNVVCSYKLSGPGDADGHYPDLVGRLPDLVWPWARGDVPAGKPVHLSEQHFLSTDKPAAALSRAIAASSQFSVLVVAASDRADQAGPARLVTVSLDTMHRNLTLGQQGEDLIVRLRSRNAGANGTCPEWSVPGVFADARPHRLLVTYAGSLLSVYVDGAARAYSVHTPPAFALISHLLARDYVSLRMNGSSPVLHLAFVYFAINLLPLAILLGLVAADPSRSVRFRTMWVAAGILLPPLALQLVLGMRGARIAGFLDVPLGVLILAAGTLVSARWWSRGPARGAVLRPGVEVVFAGYSKSR